MIEPQEPRYKYEEHLTRLVIESFFADESPEEKVRLEPFVVALIQGAYATLSAQQKGFLRRARQSKRAPPRLMLILRDALGLLGLTMWVHAHHPQVYDELGPAKLRKLAADWLKGQTQEAQDEILEAAIRYVVGKADDSDLDLIQSSLGQFLIKEEEMASFYFDTRTLPSQFDGVAYLAAVTAELDNVGIRGVDPGADPDFNMVLAAITGMVLLDEQFDPNAHGFAITVQRAWFEFLGKTTGSDGTQVTNRAMYKAIEAVIVALPGREGNGQIAYREFAYVGRQVIAEADRVPFGHPSFSTQVRLAVDGYVAGEPTIDALVLPPLSGDAAADTEIEPDNVRAVAMIYAAYQLEQMRLFDVMDRITEIFMNGMLPVGGLDPAADALEKYYWTSEDRLNTGARHSLYSRVLGFVAGDVSREVQPNVSFNDLWLRFLSSLVEYDRQQRVADMFQQRRTLALTEGSVRSSGYNLVANCSLYGWGYTYRAASRISKHANLSFKIMGMPAILKAYAAPGPLQVLERVATAEFGQAPNLVRHRTMAEAGKAIIDLVAKYATAWSDTSGQPLFTETLPGNDNGYNRIVVPGAISPEDQQVFMRQAQYWLAVNGIKDDQIDQYSQPVESPAAPSMPSSGSVGGNEGVERIKQMVAAGQMPSMDQLQGMLGGNGNLGV